jgi:hypothetical protein
MVISIISAEITKTLIPSGTRVNSRGTTLIDKYNNGGARGIRTLDLLNAIQARSQLRHSPTFVHFIAITVFSVTGLSPVKLPGEFDICCRLTPAGGSL